MDKILTRNVYLVQFSLWYGLVCVFLAIIVLVCVILASIIWVWRKVGDNCWLVNKFDINGVEQIQE